MKLSLEIKITQYGAQVLQRTEVLARFTEDCFSPDPPPPVRQLWLEIRPQRETPQPQVVETLILQFGKRYFRFRIT